MSVHWEHASPLSGRAILRQQEARLSVGKEPRPLFSVSDARRFWYTGPCLFFLIVQKYVNHLKIPFFPARL